MNDLKPCPFCGANAHAVWNAIVMVKDGSGTHEEHGVCIYCENCHAQIRTTVKHLAVEMWNRRVNDQKKEKTMTVDEYKKMVLKTILECEKQYDPVDEYESVNAISYLYEEIRRLL